MKMTRNYRQLLLNEIHRLEAQNCSADDWENLTVAVNFSTDHIRQVHFTGTNRLGVFENSIKLEGGVPFHSGIINAKIHNCTIGDNVLINNVSGYIANYNIDNDCVIYDVSTIVTDGLCHFGNGVKAHVLNETGGREVPFYNQLSSQIAYIIAMYRHRPKLIKQLIRMIHLYTESQTSHFGRIGKGTRIQNTGILRNVCLGEYSRLTGVTLLENGTVNSNEYARTRIGSDVIARDFIIATGAIVTDGAQLARTFIGQACHIGHSFSLHDSLIFSNSQLENGEACAVFAGPYSVSMHKSSLLIAAMYSFLNAGSGFNQSNHMYKLGPIHQGIIERGGRMASDSYILWPSIVGPFSMVMGRHMKHLDTSNLPFSYIIQQGTESLIVPGANLQRVGTVRDSYKWPERDKRTDPVKLDIINFDLLSPYTMGKILNGIDLLTDIKSNGVNEQGYYHYQGAIIKQTSLEKGQMLYKRAVERYLGNTLIKRITKQELNSMDDLHQHLSISTTMGSGEWSDLSGFLVSKAELNKILDQVENGEIENVNLLQELLKNLQDNYSEMEWAWAARQLEKWYDINLSDVKKTEIINILNNWCQSILGFDNMLLEDALKEFTCSSQIGYGMDGDSEQRIADFEAVRGKYDDQTFVKQITAHMQTKKDLFEQITKQINELE